MKKAIALLVVGMVLAMSPILGFMGTTVGMIGSFQAMAEDSAAKADQLAEGISLSLWSTAAGITLAPIGAIIMIIAILWIVKIRSKQAAEIPSDILSDEDPN